MLTHKSDCDNPLASEFIGNRGDRMEGCRTCRRVAVVEVDVVDAPDGELCNASHSSASAGAAPAARFVCRLHPNQAVNWKGTNCPTCAQERDGRSRRSRTDRDER